MKNIQKGGDGYVINVNESIGGMPAHSRYSNNYRPIFEGELLQNDLQNNLIVGGGGCNCGKSTSDDPSIFDLIKNQSGGGKGKKETNRFSNISQVDAIKHIALLLEPLSLKTLNSINIKILFHYLNKDKPTKQKQMGGFIMEIENLLAPLGKNNLLVLAALLLLHHFSVESQHKDDPKKKPTMLKGGDPLMSVLSESLIPLGVNPFGSAAILLLISQAFLTKKSSNKKSSYVLVGGNPLKALIAPLGTSAFIATGLLIIIDKLFINKLKELKSKDESKKVLIGGKVNEYYEKLFNIISPITFNIFAKKSFLTDLAKKNENI